MRSSCVEGGSLDVFAGRVEENYLLCDNVIRGGDQTAKLTFIVHPIRSIDHRRPRTTVRFQGRLRQHW